MDLWSLLKFIVSAAWFQTWYDGNKQDEQLYLKSLFCVKQLRGEKHSTKPAVNKIKKIKNEMK